MTYAGLGAILFRFAGFLLIGAVLVTLLPAVALGSSIVSQVIVVGGIYLLPAVVLIVASKPLGRVLAAGLE